MKNSTDQGISPAAIAETARAFMQSRILLTALELELFTAIGEGAIASGEVASKLRTDPRATDRLMNALCAMGYLQKSEGRFSNTSLVKTHLVKGSPQYMAGLMHTAYLWESWSTMTEAVRRGGSVDSPGSHAWDSKRKDAFIAAMDMRGRAQAPRIAALIDLEGVSRVLDVGGGSGIFSAAMVRAKDGLRATVFDLPDVVPLTAEYIRKQGLSERIDTVGGDYRKDAPPSGFDLVYLSAIVHSLSPEENRELIAKCAKAASPGGRVAVSDHLMDEDRTTPAAGAMFALNMLVNTKGGDTYTENEIKGWMGQAGLSDFQRIDADFGAGIIIGRKR